jgi:hypothetical protein
MKFLIVSWFSTVDGLAKVSEPPGLPTMVSLPGAPPVTVWLTPRNDTVSVPAPRSVTKIPGVVLVMKFHGVAAANSEGCGHW